MQNDKLSCNISLFKSYLTIHPVLPAIDSFTLRLIKRVYWNSTWIETMRKIEKVHFSIFKLLRQGFYTKRHSVKVGLESSWKF